jgi:hypothetical protein
VSFRTNSIQGILGLISERMESLKFIKQYCYALPEKVVHPSLFLNSVISTEEYFNFDIFSICSLQKPMKILSQMQNCFRQIFDLRLRIYSYSPVFLKTLAP